MCKEHNYELFELSVATRLNELLKKEGVKLYKTNSKGLYDAYLGGIPQEHKQFYTCNSCRLFIEKFGGLVVLDKNLKMRSAFWDLDKTPEFFKASVTWMLDIISESTITGVFVAEKAQIGIPVNYDQEGVKWTHFSAKVPLTLVNKSRSMTHRQVMAEKAEEFTMLIKALEKYSLKVVNDTLAIVESGELFRQDKCLEKAKWFKEVKQGYDKQKTATKRNYLWSVVANAPAHFCHINSSVYGTLLSDVNEGLSFEGIKRSFEAKMETYMRSQKGPSANQIYEAEKKIVDLGLADSLVRRYANYEEIPEFLWKKRGVVAAKEPKKGGVFGHIQPREKVDPVVSSDLALPSKLITWEKFKNTILPSAEKVELLTDNPNRFMALITEGVEGSENILQWDNPFSWYYHKGIDGEVKKRVEAAGGRYENNKIRCSLIWEGLTDLDLHCITPTGEHIYYDRGSRKDTYGGYLDIDMNGVDRNSEHPVENMRWASKAAEGKYVFYVNNYNENVNHSGTPFKAELEIGGAVFTFIGKPLKHKEKIVVFEFYYEEGKIPTIVGATQSNSWEVPMGQFVEVEGITKSPNMWGENTITHVGEHVFFLIKDCKDLSEGLGRGFFNETLKSELTQYRRVLEAYTAQTPIEGVEEASACGVGYSKDSEWNVTLKVTSNGNTRLYKVDRWD
ncbi:hypothetical protein D3C81_07870 [compost metagenome]